MSPLRQSAGFTLIETLVAFTIAATAVALLFRVQANSVATSILAREHTIATELAQSVLAETATIATSPSFVRSGDHGGKYRWTARKAPLARGGFSDDSDPSVARVRLLSIEVVVEWTSRSRKRQIELQTIKPFFESLAP